MGPTEGIAHRLGLTKVGLASGKFVWVSACLPGWLDSSFARSEQLIELFGLKVSFESNDSTECEGQVWVREQ